MPSLEDLISLTRSFPTNSPISDDAWQKLQEFVPEDVNIKEMLNAVGDLGHTVIAHFHANNVSGHCIAAAVCANSQGPYQNTRAILLAILACLKGSTKSENQDEALTSALCDYVAAAIAPCWARKGEDDEETEAPEYEEIARSSREASTYGLEILQILDRDYPAKLNDDVQLTLISFTNPSDPWTTETTQYLAKSILDHQLSSGYISLDDLLVDVVLKSYLRPLFSKSRPNTVTPSGRKAAFQEEHDPHRGLSDETVAIKPWKFADHRAIPIFHYTIREADESLISKQWPLFIPVILTLLDDTSTRIRSRGLIILDEFLAKFPNHILRDTGLASVFEDAVFPTLHFLPSITPENQSIQLLVPAYTALLTLARKADAKPKAGKQHYSDSPRAKLLDKILREGIFSAYFHAKEHIHIVEVLLVQTAQLLDEMGIHAVKHLKDLIPMHSEIMTSPFAALAPSTLLAAITSVQATISNCWPRLSTPAYQSELIKALVVCFLTLQDDQDKLGTTQFAAMQAELIKTATMLSATTKPSGGEEEWKGEPSIQERVAPLVAKEPLLQKLFRSNE